MKINNYKKSVVQYLNSLIKVALLLVFSICMLSANVNAQLTGAITIGSGNYPTIKVAVDSLNLQGVGAGGVTFNVPAGYTETFAATVVMTATGASGNPIVFQKSGAGANPLITAPVGVVTFSGSSTTLDGIWAFSGSDYVTIDGIDLVDNNVMPTGANSNMPDFMEYGYGFFKASATDGCQNNTIKNCTISLNRIVSVSGPAFSGNNINGSCDILMLPSAIGSIATAITPTAASGTNSNNKIYSNTLQKCNQGVAIYGYAAATPFTLGDQNNDIGGNSLSTGNTIINFGGSTNNYFVASAVVAVGNTFVTSAGNVYRVSVGGTLGTTAPSGTTVATAIVSGTATVYFLHALAPTNGILVNNQWGLNISYNTINNNSGGLGYPQVFNNARGIIMGPATSASAIVNNNTITMSSASASNFAEGIENQAGSTAAGNTVAITNNTITLNGGMGLTATAATFTVNPTGTHYGIWNNGGTPANLTISGNIFTNWTIYNTSGTVYGIYNTGVTGSSYTVSNNTLGNVAFPNATAFSGSFYNIYSSSTTATTGAYVMQNNTINNISFTTTCTGTMYCFYSSGSPSSVLIDNNRLVNLNLNFSGTQYTIYDATSAQISKAVTNNGITGTYTRTVAVTGTLYLMYFGGSSLAPSYTISGNNWSNITAATSGTGTLYCFYNFDYSTSPYPQKNIFNNTWSNINYNITGTTYLMYGYGYGDGGGSIGSSIYNNTWDNITTASATFYGFYVSSSTASPTYPINFYNNRLSNLTSNATTMYASYLSGTTPGLNFYKNKIYNVTTNNAAGAVYGLYTGASIPYNIYNNIIGDLKAPSSTLTAPAPSIAGMYFSSGTTANVSDNTIYFSSALTSSAANWGSAAIYASTTPTLTLRNNILINNSVPKGTGKAIAYQRSSTTISTYGALSNNNNMYAGTPSANNLIFYDGTNSDQTISAFKTRVFPLDVVTGTENTTFLSTTGANANYLHVDPTIASITESGGSNISGILDDFDSQTRQGNPGYVGSGTAPDMGADEFNGTPANIGAPINFTSNTNTNNSFNITWTDNSTNEAGFLVYRSLNPGGPWTLVSNTASTSIATIGNVYTLAQTGLLGGTTYYYQIYANNGVNSAALLGNASTLTCGSGLAGTYSVGPTGTYATLTAAVAALVTNGMTAPVILELQPAYTSGTETFPITLSNSIGCLNPTNTLTIRPDATVASPLLITSANTTATIDINGANFVTIDGRPGGVGSNKYLVVENTSSIAALAGNAILMRNEASNNILTYLELKSANANPAVNTANVTIGSIPGVLAIGTTTGGFGNDYNTVSFCNIHGTATLTPAVGVYAANATTAGLNANNDFNVITDNNIYDFYTASSASAGIDVSLGNNNFTITNNSIYQTATRNYAAGTQAVRGMWITPNNASLNAASGITITGNYIGGTAANCGGTAMNLTGTANYNFYGMDVSVGYGTTSSVQNNTLTNWNFTGGWSGNSVYGINIASGNVNIGTTTGNLIGSKIANGAITLTSSVTAGSFIGMRSGATIGTINFSNNTVSGIDMLGTSVSIATGFNGIAASGGATITISNDTIGSATLANSINMVTASTITTATAVRGIICNSGGSGIVNTITNNMVANMNSNYAATGTQANTMVGISVTTGSSTISGNTIRNLTTASQTTAGGGTPIVIGIAYTSTTAPSLISNNIIHTLKSTNPTTTAAIQTAGIYFSGPSSGVHVIERNTIHSISIASPTNSAGYITGVDLGVTSGVTITVKNNMLRLGLDETGASVVAPCTVRGITKNVPNSNIWFNSIYIGGTGVGTTATNTFCLARSASATDDWRNNILVNNRSNATTGGKHYAINLNATATLTLDYNDYYGAGTGFVFGYNGSTDVGGFSANWIAGDAHSYNGDPQFINPTGSAATVDLHINPAVATIIEGTGTVVASVTNDIDNQTRLGLTPTDMGADAGNFISLVCNGKPVGGTAIATGTGICVSGTTTVNLTGASNVPGISYQWMQSSTPGGTYVNVVGGSGATTASYTTPTLTATTYYECLVTCSNGGDTTFSAAGTALVNNPTITGTTAASRCGTGTVTLCATAAPGSNISWYTAPSGGSAFAYPYNNIPVTGFNNDIVANGVGTSSIPGTTYPTIGLDGAQYTFIDSTYKYVSTNALPTCFMPASKLVPSAQTSGLTYQLQSYTGNNALTVVNASTGYTSPLPTSGTLTLTTPASYGTLKVLYESVSNTPTTGFSIDALVTFTDATTQAFTANPVVNWFTASSPAYSGMGRTTPAGAIECGATPNMFELSLALNSANYSKQVQSITFSQPTVLSGTFPYSINYFHALAVGGTIPPPTDCFTTPVISSTTTFYAQASAGAGLNQTSSQGVPTVTTSTQNGGVIFNLNYDVTINSIQVYSSAAGTATVTLQNAALTTLYTSAAIPIVNGGLSTPQTLNLNWAVPAGSGYRILVANTGNSLGYSTGVFPYPMGNNVGSIVNGALTTGTSTLNYFVYNINTTVGCAGARVPVVATVVPPPAFAITPSHAVCNNNIDTLTVTSPLSNYNKYIWSPVTNLYQDAACTQPYTNQNLSTVYERSSVPATITYTCNATDTVGLCASSATSAVSVLPVVYLVASASPSTICVSGSATLSISPAANIPGASVLWQISNDDITYADIPGSSGTTYAVNLNLVSKYYRAVVLNASGNYCLASTSIYVAVYNPQITGSSPGSRCGTGTVGLSATASPGSTINWYNVSTGGTALASGINSFTTPIISSTTTFYAEAMQGSGQANLTLGTGSLQNTTTTWPSPYGQYYGGGQDQYLITAAELTALGITAGNITSMSLNLATAYTYNPLQNFKVWIASTSQTTLTAYTATGFTNVYTAPGPYSPAVGWNPYPFSTPFYWNGTSNIIIDVMFNNADGACSSTFTNNGIVNQTATSNVSTWNVHADGSCTINTFAPGITGTGYSQRPNMQFVVISGCPSVRTPVVATVTPPPSLTVTPNQTACNNAVATLSVTSNVSDFNTYIWSPITKLYQDTACTQPYTGQNLSTVYMRSTTGGVFNYTCNAGNSSAPFCANAANTAVTVQVAATVSVVSSVIPTCAGSPTNLSATFFSPGTIAIGAGATTSATYSNPFYSLWSNTHNQHLILASELTAAGMTGGPITSLGLNITDPGTLPMLELSVKMANTTATNLSSYVSPSFTTVYTNASLLPVLGVNTMVFSTPFIWDGVNNVVIEICHGNSASTATMSRTCTADNTAYVSTIHTNKTVGTGGNSQCSDNTTGLITYSLRPKFIFNANIASPASAYTWTNANGTIGTTNPITVSPTSNAVYVCTVTSNNCPYVSDTLHQWVYAVPTAPTASAPSTQCGYGLPAASVTSTSGFANPVFNWYDAPTGGNLLQTGPSTTYTSMISTSQTFYVAELNLGLCESSPRTAVVANVTAFDPISLSGLNSSCVGTGNAMTVSQTGSNNNYSFTWTASPQSGSGLVGTPTGTTQTFTPTLSGNYVYTVTGVDGANGCVSIATKAVNVYGAITGTASATQINSCANPTGLITASVSGAGTVVNNDFSSNILPSNMTSAGNSFAITGGQMQFTTGAASKNGGVLITNPTGLANNDFQIDFDMITTPGSGSPADGFSYSYGPDVVALPTGLGSTTVGAAVVDPGSCNPENGSGSALKLGFDAYGNGANTAGIYLMYNCLVWNQTPASTGVIFSNTDVSWRATTTTGMTTHVTIKINALGQVSMWLNGSQVVTNQQLPASYLSANKATWKHSFCARTGAEYEGHYIDNLLIQYNNFYEYSINGGGSWTTTLPVVAPGPGTYPVTARYVSIPGCFSNLGSVTINTPTFATPATSTGVCAYSSSMPTLSVSPTFTGATYQWQSKPTSSSTWTDVSGATSATYAIAPGSVSASTDFRCKILCGGTPVLGSPSAVRTITFDVPYVASSLAGSRCGNGTVTLGATSNPGNATLNWYNSGAGGVALGTGTSFTTPVINTTTPYYVSASLGGTNANVGKNSFTYYSSSTGATTYGLQFDATSNFVLNSVDLYPYSATNGTAGTVTIGIANSAGTILQQTVVNVTGYNQSTTPTVQTVALNFPVTVGAGYRLVMIAYSGISGLCYEYNSGNNYAYPFTAPGVSITNALLSGTSYLYYYYYFYNWSVSTGCESGLTLVPATVTPPPAISVSNPTTICSGQSTQLTAASATDPNYTYIWNPGNYPGASISVSPLTSTTYTVLATDNSGGTNSGCANTSTVSITVNPAPTVPTISSSPNIACGLQPVTLVAVSSQPGFAQIGNGSSTNVSVGQSPYSGNWEGSKIQYLITAAELNAANVYAGQLTSVAFNVSVIGVTYPMSAYTVKIGTTVATTLTAYQTGLTQVYAAPSTILPVTGWNTYQFTSPFNWNGTSNIVVEVCHNNDPVGACASCYGGTATVFSSNTSNTSVYGQYGDNTAPLNPWDLCSQIASGTTVSGTNRPDLKFGYGATTNFLWSTGATTATIIANPPLGSTNYTVTASNTFGCTSTSSKQVTVTANPLPRLVEGTDTVVCSSSIGYYIHVKDIGSYSGGYPSGTMFEWVNYTPPTVGLDSIFVNLSDNYTCIVYLPGQLGGCHNQSDSVFVDFGTAQSPLPYMQQDSVKCFGNNNGKAIAELVAGNVPSINYKWYNSSNVLVRNITTTSGSDTLKNVPIGWYYLYLFNGIGSSQISCIAVDSIEVLQPDLLTSNIESTTDNSCFGGTAGSIQISANGGTLDYSYLWNGGATTQNRTGLAAGTYTVTVTDANGCSTSISTSITQPTVINPTTTQVDVSCNGNSDGSINLTVTGGTAGYSYLWTGGITTQNRTGLAAGSYTVTVTDANGCTKTKSVTITQPAVLNASTTQGNVSCNGGSNGSINLTAIGGTPAYSYLWNSGATTQNRTGLTVGSYTVTITDTHGCTKSTITTITEPAVLVANPTIVNVSCYNTSTGSIHLAPSGGTSPYTYLWNNGATNANRNNLSNGVYFVTVTDQHGCSLTASYTVTQPNKLLINFNIVNVRCGGSNTGAATANPIGGTTPYSYLWSNGQTGNKIANLIAGTYSVTVTDAKGCVTSTSVAVTQNPSLVVIASPGPGSTATANVFGGVGPFTYYWNTIPAQTTATATGLTPCSTYKVKVMDSKNCTKISTVTIPCPKNTFADVSIEPMVNVFPNPTTGMITINALNFDAQKVVVKLFDGLGQVVFDKQLALDNNSTIIDIGDLPKGIYMMSVMNGDKLKTIKVILQ